MIDDQHIDRCSAGLKSQSELVWQSGEDRRRCVGFRRDPACGREIEFDINHPLMSRAVDHRSPCNETEITRQRCCRHYSTFEMGTVKAIGVPQAVPLGKKVTSGEAETQDLGSVAFSFSPFL